MPVPLIFHNFLTLQAVLHHRLIYNEAKVLKCPKTLQLVGFTCIYRGKKPGCQCRRCQRCRFDLGLGGSLSRNGNHSILAWRIPGQRRRSEPGIHGVTKTECPPEQLTSNQQSPWKIRGMVHPKPPAHMADFLPQVLCNRTQIFCISDK